MTRIEALKNLFRKDADATASQEAIAALGDSPSLSAEEEVALSSDIDVLDNAADFARNPQSYADRLPPGPTKDLLLAYAATLKSKKAPTTTSTSPNSGSFDPLAGLTGGDTQGASEEDEEEDEEDADIKPSRPGGKRKDKDQDKSKSKRKGKDDAEEKPPEPPKARNSGPISRSEREAMLLQEWSEIYAVALNASGQAHSNNPSAQREGRETLRTLAEEAVAYKEGQYGPAKVSLGWAIERLLDDLRLQLDALDPVQFVQRYG